MRAGSIKKKGPGTPKVSVVHLWREKCRYPGRYKTDCDSGTMQHRRNIDFNSDYSACKACVALHVGSRDRAIKALAKLGVK